MKHPVRTARAPGKQAGLALALNEDGRVSFISSGALKPAEEAGA